MPQLLLDDTVPTFEDVDQYVQSSDLSALHGVGVRGLDPAAALDRVQTAYLVVRPILRLVGGTPFFPAAWRVAVNGFVAILDAAGA